jgi:hypothetical protein
MDLETSTVVMTFNEPVNPHTFNKSAVVLQGASNSSVANVSTLRLDGNGAVTEVVTASMTVTLVLSQSDEISVKSDTGFATSTSDTFLSLDAGAVADTVGLAVVEVATATAAQCSEHGEDLLRAELTSVMLNFSNRQLELTFSDVVDGSTYKASSIVVQSASTISNTNYTSYRLTGGEVPHTNLHTMVITLSTADFVALGENGELATDENNTFVTLLSSAFEDVSGRDVLAVVDGKAVQASSVAYDVTAPTLLESKLDLTLEQLVLNF